MSAFCGRLKFSEFRKPDLNLLRSFLPRHTQIETNGDRLMKSAVVKRSVVIGGHKTSVSLEDEFWTQLREIAGAKQATVSQLLAQIDGSRQYPNLSSAIRVYVLEHFKNSANST
jgi:predicted DNA-binding ribbon-helix-helix protein